MCNWDYVIAQVNGSLPYAIIGMSMYVMLWFIVHKLTVHCLVYSKLLSQTTSVQYVNLVSSKMLLSSTDQSVCYYTLHGFVLFVQSEAFLPL